MYIAPATPAMDAAFDLWMSENAPSLKVYAKAYATKFLERLSDGITAYRQMEMVSESGVPMDTARKMISALLRIYVTGHAR